jgi:hypothetical protein
VCAGGWQGREGECGCAGERSDEEERKTGAADLTFILSSFFYLLVLQYVCCDLSSCLKLFMPIYL